MDNLEVLNVEGKYSDKELIISLTSYKGRIDVVDIAIKCLLRQSVKVNRIILWLASDEFSEIDLPERIVQLRNYGVDIRFCDNLLAHKKYFYAMQEFPNSYIITFDDDFYYEKDMILNLLNLKNKFNSSIVTNRAHLISFKNGKIIPYKLWEHNTTNSRRGHQIFATGGVGTLYQPRFFKKYIYERNLIIKICPRADDVWLKFMAYLNDVKVVTNKKYNKDFITLPESQKEKLVSGNVTLGGNDSQFRKALDFFKVNENSFQDITSKKPN